MADQPPAQNEAMLAWIQEFAPYGVVTTDVDFRVQTWNHWMEIHSEFNSQRAIGRSLFELFPDLIERRLVERFHRALAGEINLLATALHEYLLPLSTTVRESGYQHMRQTARIAPLVLGEQTKGVIIVIEDVTQREFQAAILRTQHERDQILSWALAYLLKARDPRRTIREVFFKVAEHLDFDTYFLYLFEGSTDAIKLHSVGGVPPETEQQLASLPANNSFCGFESESGKALAIGDVQSSSDEKLLIPRQLGIRAYALLPLLVGERKIGTLCFATRTRAVIDKEELGLLSTIAEYLAVALNRESTDLALRDAQQALGEHAKQLEIKVAERTASLKETISELETFSYSLAHDLRAPIRALIGYCDVLVEDYSLTFPEEANAVVQRLLLACGRLDVLTRDLLQFTKVSRQKILLSVVPISEVLADIVSSAPPRLKEALVIHEPLLEVLAQRTLLQQCLVNLFDNALKFVEPGASPQITLWAEKVDVPLRNRALPLPFSPARYLVGGTGGIDTEKPESEIPPKPNPPRVRIWVEDRGIGIPVESQQKVFGIFERGPNYERYEGTGIGLAIVARAMQRMGGSCGVESERGVGSRFWLEFLQG